MTALQTATDLKAALLDLAKRCEEATAPSYALGRAIYLALGMKPFPTIDNPTASLDAAMTLVPEGWRVGLLGEISGRRWHCTLHRHDREVGVSCTAQVAALALTAAALRARAAMEGA